MNEKEETYVDSLESEVSKYRAIAKRAGANGPDELEAKFEKMVLLYNSMILLRGRK